MKISSKQLHYDLDVLRHGGPGGIRHFLEIGQECFYKGGQELLNDWIALGAPALPDADRRAGIGALLSSLFADEDVPEEAADKRHAGYRLQLPRGPTALRPAISNASTKGR